MSVRADAFPNAQVSVVGAGLELREEIVAILCQAGLHLVTRDAAPDLVVLAAEGTDTARNQAIRETVATHGDTPVVAVLPASANNASLRRSLLAGAASLVFAADLHRALVPTVRAALAGQLAVPGALRGLVAPRPLSHREKQILALVMRGLTNREIAARLYLAESTVKTHLSSAFRKIDARSRAEAVERIQDPESELAAGIIAAARYDEATAESQDLLPA